MIMMMMMIVTMMMMMMMITTTATTNACRVPQFELSPKHFTMGTKRQNIQVLTLDLQEQFTVIYSGVYIYIQTEFTFIYKRSLH